MAHPPSQKQTRRPEALNQMWLRDRRAACICFVHTAHTRHVFTCNNSNHVCVFFWRVQWRGETCATYQYKFGYLQVGLEGPCGPVQRSNLPYYRGTTGALPKDASTLITRPNVHLSTAPAAFTLRLHHAHLHIYVGVACPQMVPRTC